jgi:two-component system OmpR family response regulator
MRILIVDDEDAVAQLLAVVLARLPAETLTVNTVAEARTLLAEDGFQLVISDCLMPGETGIDLLRWIRAEKLPLRFGFFTGSYMRFKDEIDLLDPDFILEKPLEMADVLEQVRKALEAPQD